MIYLEMADDVFGAAAVAEARRSPALVHFEGFKIDKPWHYLSKHPYRKAYLEHRPTRRGHRTSSRSARRSIGSSVRSPGGSSGACLARPRCG